ncbi:hypothetical protein Ddc_18091 [Ditylenchus destructor]|nr:hypothetical protein Ddc_18091 [Ditylenchus destructor]
MLRSKTLMKSELDSDQLVLTFPITWWFYNQTSDFKSEQALTEKNTASALSTSYSTSRVRRGWNDWSTGKQITACVVGLAGALGGAGLGAAQTLSRFGWGAVPGAIVGGAGGFNLGADFADYIGYRRKRSLILGDYDSNRFACELLRQVFLASDHNQDGRLSIEEFGFIADQSAQSLESLDLDNNTFIEPREFNSCLSSRRLRRCYNCGNCESSYPMYSMPVYQTGYYIPATNVIYI